MFQYLQAYWSGVGVTVKPAIVTGTATLLAATFGFGGLILQLRTQSRQSQKSIAENERRKIKARLYEEALQVTRSLADSAIELATKLRLMIDELAVASNAAQAAIDYQAPQTRFPRLGTLYAAFTEEVLRFIFLVENNRVVDPRIVIFRTAMSVVLHDTREIMYGQFIVHVMPSIPVENPAGGIFPYTPPAPEGLQVIKILTDRFIESLNDGISYTEDFAVELQNRLLGDLFGHEVEHRTPIDPDSKVIELDRAQELELWFRANTAWGRQAEAVEHEVRARFNAAVA